MKSIYIWGRSLFHRFFQSPLTRRIVKNSGYLFSATGAAAFMSMLQGILTARLLGPSEFGALGAITVFTSTINRFASFRMNELVVRYVGHYEEQGDSARACSSVQIGELFRDVWFDTCVCFDNTIGTAWRYIYRS